MLQFSFRFMFECAVFDEEVKMALIHMKRSREVCQNAVHWLESHLKQEKEKVWKLLMTNKNIDLSSGMPYLIKLSKSDTV